MVDIEAVIERLRQNGSDTTNVEAKAAAGGMPESILATMSAFANLPGGGLILLGVDEARAFSAVRLTNPAQLVAIPFS